jgi:hypothetical protein
MNDYKQSIGDSQTKLSIELNYPKLEDSKKYSDPIYISKEEDECIKGFALSIQEAKWLHEKLNDFIKLVSK